MKENTHQIKNENNVNNENNQKNEKKEEKDNNDNNNNNNKDESKESKQDKQDTQDDTKDELSHKSIFDTMSGIMSDDSKFDLKEAPDKKDLHFSYHPIDVELKCHESFFFGPNFIKQNGTTAQTIIIVEKNENVNNNNNSNDKNSNNDNNHKESKVGLFSVHFYNRDCRNPDKNKRIWEYQRFEQYLK